MSWGLIKVFIMSRAKANLFNRFKNLPLFEGVLALVIILLGAGLAVVFTDLAPWLAFALLAAAVFLLAVFKNPVYGILLVIFLVWEWLTQRRSLK